MNRQTDVRLSLWAVCPVRWCCYQRINVVYSEDLDKFVHKKKKPTVTSLESSKATVGTVNEQVDAARTASERLWAGRVSVRGGE